MSSLLKDEKGNTSSMRVTMIAVVVVVLGVFTMANVASIAQDLMKGNEIGIVDFAQYMVWALGLVLTGKVSQSATEKMKNKNGTKKEDGGE